MNPDIMKAKIEASLGRFWEERSVETDKDPGSVDDFIDALDSLTAVDALIEIEQIVGMELPEGELIRRGGYDSVQQFVEHLSKRVMTYVLEHKK